MNFEPFDQARVALNQHASVGTRGASPPQLDDVLSASACETARTAISKWSGYRPSPLHILDSFADKLGIASLYYKDESKRFGLGRKKKKNN